MTRYDALPDDPRLLELLADRALTGLSTEGEVELSRLAAEWPEADLESLERTAAEIDLALAGAAVDVPLSDRLRGDVLRQADEHFRAARRLRDPSAVGEGIGRSWAGWVLAFAAGLLAVLGWWPRLGTTSLDPGTSGWRDVAVLPDAVRVPWGPGGDPTGADVKGEVVWSTDRQRGFMVISGLAPNDPTEAQYQLWIFDRNQDEATPIDGGVFDVSTSGETVVSIDAKLEVAAPYLFAVTVEKPGGVVVSDRSRLAAAAAVPE